MCSRSIAQTRSKHRRRCMTLFVCFIIMLSVCFKLQAHFKSATILHNIQVEKNLLMHYELTEPLTSVSERMSTEEHNLASIQSKDLEVFDVSITEIRNSTQCEAINLGCLPMNGVITSGNSDPASMTRTKCFSTCSKTTKIVGLHGGSFCKCAQLSEYTPPSEEVECSAPCSGNRNETCGGKQAIQWYRLKSTCVKGGEVADSFTESRFIGCFVDEIERKWPWKSILQKKGADVVSASTCILKCSDEKYPLAINVVGKNSRCLCGRFGEQLNWHNHVKVCDDTSLKVYQTLAQDERCKPLKFLPVDSGVKQAVLVSFPGSGNTWARHLIEQASGIYTGSVYGDFSLLRSGHLGEKPGDMAKTFVIKDHMFSNSMRKWHSAIFLVRNPYDAQVADFHRMQSSSHVGYAKPSDFHTLAFKNKILKNTWWHMLFYYVIDSKKPFHIVKYEDLLEEPINEIRKVMEFLQTTNNFQQNDLELRLLCLSQNLQGSNKRKNRGTNDASFTNEMKNKVNSVIEIAEKKAAQAGLKFTFTSYKKQIS